MYTLVRTTSPTRRRRTNPLCSLMRRAWCTECLNASETSGKVSPTKEEEATCPEDTTEVASCKRTTTLTSNFSSPTSPKRTSYISVTHPYIHPPTNGSLTLYDFLNFFFLLLFFGYFFFDFGCFGCLVKKTLCIPLRQAAGGAREREKVRRDLPAEKCRCIEEKETVPSIAESDCQGENQGTHIYPLIYQYSPH